MFCLSAILFEFVNIVDFDVCCCSLERAVIKQIKPKPANDYTERMRRKWIERQSKRLMKAILELKRFDPEQIARDIKPENDRIAYNEEKKRAIEANFRRMNREVSEMRARLIPPNDVDLEAQRLDYISNNVDNMLSSAMDGFHYDMIKNELEEEVCDHLSFYSFQENDFI